MRLKNLLTTLIFISSMSSMLLSQTTFERTYGGPYNDLGNSVLQTTDNGYIIIGTSRYYNSEINSIYLIRTDSNGDTLWTRVFGGKDHASGNFIQATSDGGYIISGSTSSFGAGGTDVYLIKINTTGDTLWTKTFGGTGTDYGQCVRQTTDLGYIIAGHTNSFGSGATDIYLIKTDAYGDTLWTKVFGGIEFDWCKNVQQTSDEGYIIVGDTKSYGAGDSDVYLIKTDALGDTLWTKTYGGVNYDRGYSIVQTMEGYIIAGITESFGDVEGDVYIIKTNSTGDTLWTKTFGGEDYETANFIQKTSAGDYIIVGETESYGVEEGDVFLLKIDSEGNVLWSKTIGGSGYDGGNCVQQTFDGGYIITGYSYSYSISDNRDIYLVKTDANGGLTRIENTMIPIRPIDFHLTQNYPNPFNSETIIKYELPKNSEIEIIILNSLGQKIKTLINSQQNVGFHQIRWDGLNSWGNQVGSGLYFIQMKTKYINITKKILLIR